MLLVDLPTDKVGHSGREALSYLLVLINLGLAVAGLVGLKFGFIFESLF
jgi:hypothetical protein